MTQSLSTSFTPGEVVPAGRSLTVHGATGVTGRTAQTAVHVLGRSGEQRVTVKVDGDAIEVPTSDLDDGSYVLIVDDLFGDAPAKPKRGKHPQHDRRVGTLVAPFTIASIAGKIDERTRVEHVVRVSVGEFGVTRLSARDEPQRGGGYLELIKAVDRVKGEPAEFAFDARGKRVDASRVFAELTDRRTKHYGRLHETLYHHIEALGARSRVDVVVWPVLEPQPLPEKSERGATKEPPAAQLDCDARAMERATELARVVSKLGKLRGKPSPDFPAVQATLTVDAVRKLSHLEAVGVAVLDDQSEVLDLGTSIAISRTDKAHTLGFDGSGVRVAVFESGPSDTTNLTFAGRFTNSPAASDHARLTSAVIRNTERSAPHGHAPGCDLFSANSSNNDALRWAANQGCTVISQSFHRDSEPGGAGLQSDDILKDFLALRWPYPTIVQAAGNFFVGDADNVQPPSSEFVNHKGFNTLAVGSHDDSAGAMAGSSVFRNPSSSHGDRELPEISANGTTVSAVGESMSGTSFAAPAAAGVAAVLQDVDPTLQSWPEGCRAILMATAFRNVSNGTWWADVSAGVDAGDGAGAIDAQAGVRVAQSRRGRNNTASRRGWDVGTLRSGDFDGNRMSTFRYRISVPQNLFFARVKVALAWDSSVSSILGIPLGSNLNVDFDLIVRDANGTQVAHSSSWDNSYEIAEFVGTNGASYDVLVRRWSGTDDVWYGLAWNVEGWNLTGSIWDLFTTARG